MSARSDGALRIETNSEKRAAALREKIEGACPGLIRDRMSELKDPLRMIADSAGKTNTPDERMLEQQTLAREFKELHYRKWIDQPVPRSKFHGRKRDTRESVHS